jgi:hypothetical protein
MDVLISAREYGDTLGSFKRAFKDHKGNVPDMDYYVHTDMTPGHKSLPWQHLQVIYAGFSFSSLFNMGEWPHRGGRTLDRRLGTSNC